MGYCIDTSNVYHGFLRAADHSFKTFDIPDAGKGSGQGTVPFGLKSEGAVAGYYTDANNVNHGFLRAKDGIFKMFDVPGAGKGSGQGTLAFNINEKRTIAGTYLDASNVYHGFVRFRSGSIKTFDVPGAGKGSGQGTQTAAFSGLRPSGAITGYYGDRNSAFHGYVRAPDGSFKRV